MVDLTGVGSRLRERDPDIVSKVVRGGDELHPYHYCESFYRPYSRTTVDVVIDCALVPGGHELSGAIVPPGSGERIAFPSLFLDAQESVPDRPAKVDAWVRSFCAFLDLHADTIIGYIK